MPTFTLDGREIPFEPGETIIAAARRAGIEIPHFCWHPDLEIAGNCRMCLVEVEGWPKLQIACNTQPNADMVVKAESDWARKARTAVMEFLLINHPLDCPICDQAGECKLQDYAFEHGHAESRFEEDKVDKRKRVEFSDKIMYDGERCILCTRCVRLCRDVAGSDELSIANRGSANEIIVSPGKELHNPYSMNVIDLCPVGALTSRDFRFTSRIWFMDFTRSVCQTCSRGCNVVVGSREGKVLRLVPARNDAVNGPWMCDEGRLNYRFVNENRLEAPLVGGSEVEWDGALDATADRLKGVVGKGDTVFGLASADLTNENLFLFRRLMADVLGTKSLDTVKRMGEGDDILRRPEKNANGLGAQLIGVAPAEGGIGLDGLPAAIESGKITTLVVWGEDPTAIPELEPLLGKLTNLIVVTATRSEGAEKANIALPGCTNFEQEGTFINFEGRVQRIRQAVPPHAGAQPDWQILRDLLGLLGDEVTIVSARSVFKMLAAEIPAFAGLTYKGLGDMGLPIAEGAAETV
jgi:NADH-quinone oxidoreductase subunit G